MNKKTLRIAFAFIALIAGLAFIVVGIQEFQTARNRSDILPKNEIEKAVNESKKEFVVYEHPDTKARISYPKNWTAAKDEKGSGVSFAFLGGAINVRLVSDDFADKKEPITLDEYSKELMIQGKEEAAKQKVAIEPINDSAVTFAGNPGHQWHYTVTIGDVKGRGMQVWTIKNNKSYVLTYTAAQDLFDAFTPVAQKMISSLILP